MLRFWSEIKIVPNKWGKLNFSPKLHQNDRKKSLSGNYSTSQSQCRIQKILSLQDFGAKSARKHLKSSSASAQSWGCRGLPGVAGGCRGCLQRREMVMQISRNLDDFLPKFTKSSKIPLFSGESPELVGFCNRNDFFRSFCPNSPQQIPPKLAGSPCWDV